MSSDLNSIWLDWRAKVPNGVPNPSNAYHLVLLKELCLKKGIDKDIVDNVMLTLEDVDDEKIKWKDKDGKDKETSLDTIKRYQYDKDFKSKFIILHFSVIVTDLGIGNEVILFKNFLNII